MKNEPVADLWTFLVRLAQKNENDPTTNNLAEDRRLTLGILHVYNWQFTLEVYSYFLL